MPAITVALVDDHPLMVDGLVDLLSRSGSFDVIATGTATRDILDICMSHGPDVIVVDLLMDDDVCRSIATATRITPGTKVVTFTGAEGIEPAILALEAGAAGYVSKGSSSEELVRAIESVHAGETYITTRFANEVIGRLRNAPFRRKAARALILSVREFQIIHLLMTGKSDRQIAAVLRMSGRALERHMAVLRSKLQVRSRREAMIAAKKLGRSPLVH